MIWTKLTRTDAVFSRAACMVLLCAGKRIFRYLRKIHEKSQKIHAPEGTRIQKGDQRGTRGAQAPWWRGPPGRAGGGGAWGPRASTDAPLWHIFISRPETLETGTLFRDLISVPPPPRFQDREHQENSSRHPAGGEDHHREPLHHHGRLPDEL